MAEGGIGSQDSAPASSKINLVCRYFIHRVCTKGSNCRYIHDRSGSVPSDNICKFYQSNRCTFGKKCRYSHVRREDSRPSSEPVVSPSVQSPANDRLRVSPSVQSPANDRLRVSPSVQVPANDRLLPGPDLRRSHMVTLSKKGFDHSIKQSQKKKAQDSKWAQAKVFVPGQKYDGACASSYAAAIGATDSDEPSVAPCEHRESESSSEWHNQGDYALCSGLGGLPRSLVTADTPLCPFYAAGECQDDEDCAYVHGDICDMCGLPQLHPANAKQREEHCKECLAEHEKEMEKAFALQASENKECEICLESVLDKESNPGTRTERRFGILENCNHCFCLKCIKQWRGNKDSSIEMQKYCPTCRTRSDFITPSKYWVETSEEKTKLIEDYKNMLKSKPCQYFKQGKGECPFDKKCFYLHALADGTVVEGSDVACGITVIKFTSTLMWHYRDDAQDIIFQPRHTRNVFYK